MENATKALLIAAAILIAIVVITLGVFVLGKGSTLVKENSDMSEVEITTYNSKFEGYCGQNIRGAQVRQLLNAVNQHNRTNADDESRQIKIKGVGAGTATEKGGQTDNKPNDIKTGFSYNVTPSYGQGGLVDTIEIQQASK